MKGRSKGRKKRYRSPRLTTYGKVSELTLMPAGGGGGGGGGGTTAKGGAKSDGGSMHVATRL
jgi:hypothetical protein